MGIHFGGSLWVLVLFVLKTSADTDEPSCYSLFDYEEKMLEKVVRLENKVELLQDKLESVMKKPNTFFHALSVNTMSPAPGSILAFTDVKARNDEAYNSQTGVFTAKTEGLYWFAVYLCVSGNQWLQIHIMVNDRSMTNAIVYDNYLNCASANIVAELKPGDRVFVQAGNTSGGKVLFEDHLRASMLTGALIN